MADETFSINYRKSARESIADALAAMKRASERKAVRRAAMGVGVLVLLMGGFFTYLALKPAYIPDTEEADIEDILDFALLSDEFNKLPLQQRLDLLKGVVSRLKGMGDGDSGLMAAFAASLTREAMEQLRKNGERLFVDLMDSFAEQYQGVPEADRKDFMDRALVQMLEMMETLAGEDFGDEARNVNNLKRESRREMTRLRESGSPPIRSALANRMMRDMNRPDNALQDPKQKERVTRFGRDMVRHMRGQDLASGKDLAPPEPPPEPGAGGRRGKGRPGAPSSPPGGSPPASAPPAAAPPPGPG